MRTAVSLEIYVPYYVVWCDVILAVNRFASKYCSTVDCTHQKIAECMVFRNRVRDTETVSLYTLTSVSRDRTANLLARLSSSTFSSYMLIKGSQIFAQTTKETRPKAKDHKRTVQGAVAQLTHTRDNHMTRTVGAGGGAVQYYSGAV